MKPLVAFLCLLPFACPVFSQDSDPAIAPTETVNLLADPGFEDFTHFLKPKGIAGMMDLAYALWAVMDLYQHA